MILLSIFVLLIGLCIGSFVNVLIYRLPIGMSLSKPGSHCPYCNAKIKWYDNIPIFSFLFLGAKCRSCGKPISPRYFLVEVINLLLWAVIILLYGVTFYSVAMMLATSIFVAIFAIDAKTQTIPDSLNITIAILGIACLIYSIFSPEITSVLGTVSILWWERLIGGVATFALLVGIFYAYKALRGREGIGGGDVKLMGAAGFLLGWRAVVLAFGLAAIFACIILVIKMAAKKLDAEKPFAFGPYLVTALFISMLLGEKLIALYLGLFA